MIGEVGSFPDSLVIPLKTNMEPKKMDGWVSRDLRDFHGIHFQVNQPLVFGGGNSPDSNLSKF